MSLYGHMATIFSPGLKSCKSASCENWYFMMWYHLFAGAEPRHSDRVLAMRPTKIRHGYVPTAHKKVQNVLVTDIADRPFILQKFVRFRRQVLPSPSLRCNKMLAAPA